MWTPACSWELPAAGSSARLLELQPEQAMEHQQLRHIPAQFLPRELLTSPSRRRKLRLCSDELL